jgi:hypothetical protein
MVKYLTFLATAFILIPGAFSILNAGTYYSGSGGILDNCAVSNCDYLTTKCLIGSYLSGCGGATSGTCPTCNNLPATNAAYSSNGGSSGVPTGCQWTCNAGFAKDSTSTNCIVDSCSVAVANIVYINNNYLVCTYQCAAGYYGATIGGAKGPLSCTACNQGSYTAVSNSAASCTLCEAGKFNNAAHSTGCSGCLSDTYTLSTDTGKTACLLCTAATPACLIGEWRTGCGPIGNGNCVSCSNSAKT